MPLLKQKHERNCEVTAMLMQQFIGRIPLREIRCEIVCSKFHQSFTSLEV